ncbi:MAG: hypothetical protein V7724_18405 [Sediminicola sp.]
MSETLKAIFKIIGLIFLFIIIMITEMLIFLAIFGEGGQASNTLNNGLTKFVMYFFPAMIVGRIAYKTFRRQ